MRLSDIKKVKRELSIDFDNNQKLTFWFYPNEYTPEHEEVSQRAASEPTIGAYLKKLMCPILATWDAEDDFPEAVFEKRKKDDVPAEAAGTIQDMTGKTLLKITAAGEPNKLVWDRGKEQLVEAWDNDPTMKLTGGTVQKPIPLTPLGLHRIPLAVLLEMMDKINEDLRPGKQKLTTSESSFS